MATMGSLRTALFSGLALAALADAIPQASSTPSPSPCAVVSSLSSSFLAANPTATAAEVDGAAAQACLDSVPLHQTEALALISSLTPYVELQSTLSYLKNPPSGYLYPGVDLLAGLNEIAAGVSNSSYPSEYAFQADLQELFIAAKDAHLVFVADALGVFTWERENTPLVSISLDGFSLPVVFCTSDMITVTLEGVIVFRNVTGEYTPSPVVQINEVDVATYLEAQAFTGPGVDPDANYNYIFSETSYISQYGITGDGFFPNPLFFPGPRTAFTFENGTTHYVHTAATISGDFTGISSGEDFYQKFCNPANKVAANATAQTHQESPTAPFYPWPVIKSPGNSVHGYYLNDTGYTDVAVLVINSFSTRDDPTVFLTDVGTFLGEAAQSGKTKLVIDLQASSGEYYFVADATFNLLFPNMKPMSSQNMRATADLNAIGSGYSAYNEGGTFDFTSYVKPDGTPFTSWANFFGPTGVSGDNFTELFMSGQPYNQSGTPAFASADVIMLTEGYCTGACAYFHEMMMKEASVKTVSAGGRPQNGPMQAVGGTKGTGAFYMGTIYQSGINSTNQTDLTGLPLSRAASVLEASVNGVNNIRLGDQSETPLQFVYTAADCRFWYTHEMIPDNVPVWTRAASIMFFGNTSYCVEGSTNHPSSVSGGALNSTNGLGAGSLPADVKNGTTSPSGTTWGDNGTDTTGYSWASAQANASSTSSSSSSTSSGSATATSTAPSQSAKSASAAGQIQVGGLSVLLAGVMGVMVIV